MASIALLTSIEIFIDVEGKACALEILARRSVLSREKSSKIVKKNDSK